MVVKVPPNPLPPLQNGDHLTRDEFERRYHAMPKNIKAELIEGEVHMASPVRFDQHGRPQFQVITWLGNFQAFTPGTEGADNATVRLDLNNEPQPDGFLFIDPDKGGQVSIDEDGYVIDGPELIAEISASSVSIDLKKKLSVYRRNKVREYIVWRVYDEEIDWFFLDRDDYLPIPADEAGIRKSRVFPGLWLDAAAMLRGDMMAVMAVLQEGLASSEHAEFVERLKK